MGDALKEGLARRPLLLHSLCPLLKHRKRLELAWRHTDRHEPTLASTSHSQRGRTGLRWGASPAPGRTGRDTLLENLHEAVAVGILVGAHLVHEHSAEGSFVSRREGGRKGGRLNVQLWVTFAHCFMLPLCLV